MSSPRFAVVRLREGADTIQLYSLLARAGYAEVSFVENLRDAIPSDSLSENTESSQPSRKRKNEDISAGSSPLDIKPFVNGVPKLPFGVPQSKKKAVPFKFLVTPKTEAMTKQLDQGIAEKDKKLTVLDTDSDNGQSSTSPPSNDEMSSPKATARIIEKSFPQDQELLLLELNNYFNENQDTIINNLKLLNGKQSCPKKSNDSENTPNTSVPTPEEIPVECQKCHAKLKISRMHCIRYHLAMHFPQKQFKCSMCNHCSHLNGNVKIHIRSNHPEGATICESITDEMVDGWCTLAKECFPQLADKVERLLRQRHAERKYAPKKNSHSSMISGDNMMPLELYKILSPPEESNKKLFISEDVKTPLLLP